MATKLYVGINGSGKSYEVVTVVILGALRVGRRVVSNIAGLNYEAMVQHIELERKKYPLEDGAVYPEIGSILSVSHEDVMGEYFFRTDYDDESVETTIQAGDLLVLDEIWRFWEERDSVTSRQLNYFRMHRHFVDPVTQRTCENVLITQVVSDVPLKIKGVIEQTYAMKKHTELGLQTHYRVDIFTKTPLAKTEPIKTLQRKYNPDFFKFYKSHSVNTEEVQAVEESVDTRGNMLKTNALKYGLPIFLCILGFTVYFIWSFFHPKQKKVDDKISSASAAANAPKFNSTWRVIGSFTSDSGFIVLLKDKTGAIRSLVNPPKFKKYPLMFVVELPEGDLVSTYSGDFQTDSLSVPK